MTKVIDMQTVILIYFLIVNVITFLLYGIDKWKAIHNKWRVKEATLLTLAFIGGALGALLGMYIFHHKTHKWYFKYTVPIALVIYIVILLYFLIYV